MRWASRFGFAAIVLAVVGAMVSALSATAATTMSLYLVGDGEPVASLSTSSPPGGALPNFDPGRDDEPGLLLKDTKKGLGETDPTKYQQWQTSPGEIQISGAPTFRIWAALKDFEEDEYAEFIVYLLDCNGSSCQLLDSVTNKMTSRSSFSQELMTFAPMSLVIGPSNHLAVRIVVTDNSTDDMWFAYHTSTYPARLQISGPPPPATTTTTTSPTTTTTNPTTTSTAGSSSTSSSPTTTTPAPTTTSGDSAPTTSVASTSSTTAATSAEGPADDTTTTSTAPVGQTDPSPPPQEAASSPDARPTSTATEKLSLVVENRTDGSAQVFAFESTKLSPQEGLMVSFLSAAESVRNQLLASAGLGGIGALLVVFGMRRRIDESQRDNQDR